MNQRNFGLLPADAPVPCQPTGETSLARLFSSLKQVAIDVCAIAVWIVLICISATGVGAGGLLIALSMFDLFSWVG